MKTILFFIMLFITSICNAQGWTLKTKYRTDSTGVQIRGHGTFKDTINYTISLDSIKHIITFASNEGDTTIIHYGLIEKWPDAPSREGLYYRTSGYGNIIYYPRNDKKHTPKVVREIPSNGPLFFHIEYFN